MSLKNKFKLTEIFIKSLKPPKKEIYYYDTEVKGFCIRCFPATKRYPKGSKSFYLRYKGKNYSLGEYYPNMLKFMRDRAMRYRISIYEGVDPTQLKADMRNEFTIGQLFDFYIQHNKNYIKTWQDDEKYIKPKLNSIKSIKISQLSKTTLKQLHIEIGNKTKAMSNKVIGKLSAAYNLAKNQGLFEGENPCKSIQKFTIKNRVRFLTAEENKKLLKALKDFEKIEYQKSCVIYTLLLTGIRYNNVVSMKWKDLDLNKSIWLIPNTKNGEPLLKPVVSQLLTHFKQLKQLNKNIKSPFVFPNSKNKEGYDKYLQSFKDRLLKHANIKDFTFHDFRHNLGSQLAMSGASNYEISQVLGHKSPNSSASYVHLANNIGKNNNQKIANKILD